MHIRKAWGKLGCVLGEALLLVWAVAAASAQQNPDQAAIDRGRSIYQKYGCFVCHGAGGGGEVRNKNAKTAEQVPGLTKSAEGFTAQELRDKVLEGVVTVQKRDPRGPMPPLSMPAYREKISEEELNDLVLYLLSLATAPPEARAARPPAPDFMLGEGNCRVCHEAVVGRFANTIHAKARPEGNGHSDAAVTCATCHGQGDRHAQNPGDPRTLIRFDKASPASAHDKNAACLGCHEKGLRFSWRGSTHESRDMACVDCHKVMEPVSDRNLFVKQQEMEVCFQCHQVRRAQTQRTSHMPFREGKITCTDCHNPHGTANEKLLAANSVNESCYKCHAEKRGPFLWEHPPVAENCLNCHEPHGSNHASLLKSERPRLCQRCHIESRHPTTPQAAATRFVFNRSCSNCHSQIHGSNHPSGVRFQR